MAEEALVKESLSREMVLAGTELARKLTRTSLKIDGLLWLYFPELNAWRFVVSSSQVKTLGPKKIYEDIRSAISKNHGTKPRVQFEDIIVVDSDDPLIKPLRRAINTGEQVGGIRLKGNVFDGVLVEDAYVYRLN
jgi:hypothetical protein